MDNSASSPQPQPSPPATAPALSQPVTPPAAAQPITEITFPAPLSEDEPDAPSTPKPTHPKRLVIVGLGVGVLALLVVTGYVSYTLGYSHGGTAQVTAAAAETSAIPLRVPKGATVIEQCAKGRGTQYVLPSDIPHGPVYNVYQGKVIGIEYMVSDADVANKASFLGLPLDGKKYDHLDIGLESEGHAGFPVQHHHVDLYNISRTASEAITCK
jgi:hypothetical protein